MRVLLDTATFIWAAQAPELLSRSAASWFARNDAELEISVMSISEIAIKHGLGKLTFGGHDVLQTLDDLKTTVLSYRTEHACALFGLPRHHADPFDRQIIAQAMVEEIPVVTSDRTFRLYKEIETIW